MNIDQIIGKLMGDGFVGEEKSALEAWKKEAEDNIKALQEIKKIAAFSNSLKGYEDYNTDAAWDSFAASMESDSDSVKKADEVQSKPEKRGASIFTLGYLARIAAILVIVVGSLFAINTFMNSGTDVAEPLIYSAKTEMLDIDLNDGTNVILDKSSDMNVIDNRTVTLKGRAHFNVQKSDTKQFSIELPVGKVVVLGTEFTIDADDSTTEIYVKEGTVRYELDNNRVWTLKAGQLVRMKNNEAVVIKGDDNYDSWKNNTLVFRDHSMVEVVAALSRHFKKEIILENKKDFSNCNVMDVFPNFTLNDILNGLSKTHGLKYALKDDKVYITSANC
ncbi:MAG: FecR domain-containing protein [Bacteroidota bacterium]